MKLVFKEQRTLEGFTWLAGEHEVDDRLAELLLATFPKVVGKPVAKRSEPKGTVKKTEVKKVTVKK